MILPLPNANAAVWDIVVQNSRTVTNKLNTKMLVKLPEGDDGSSHDIFNGVPKYTYSQITAELKKSEWIKPANF